MDDSKARNRFWEAYNEEAEAYDKESLEGWKNDIDMVLLFVSNHSRPVVTNADLHPRPVCAVLCNKYGIHHRISR